MVLVGAGAGERHARPAAALVSHRLQLVRVVAGGRRRPLGRDRPLGRRLCFGFERHADDRQEAHGGRELVRGAADRAEASRAAAETAGELVAGERRDRRSMHSAAPAG